MWIALGILLLAVWFVAKLVVGVTSMAIHLALLAAVAFVVVHFARRAGNRLRRSGGSATGAI